MVKSIYFDTELLYAEKIEFHFNQILISST